MKARWSIPALGAFFVLIALAVAGCGSSGSIPSGSVATVAGNPISKRAVDHWMYVYVKGQDVSSGETNEPVIVPNDPPEFANCISEARADIPQLKKAAASKIRSECKTDFTSLNNEVLSFLIESYWYQALAHKQGITVTNAEISKQLDKEKKAQGIKTNAQYQQTLAQYGETTQDVFWRTRVSTVFTKLEAKYGTKVTKADIAAYYKANPSKFGTPETRDMRIVLAKTDADAKSALAALKHGSSWNAVAKKYSTDPTTKDKGGLQTGVSKGEDEQALSNASFAAPANKLVGPVKGEFGYYVFEVTKINAATHESLAKASPQIKSTLTSSKATAAQNAINKKAKAAYGARTLCAAAYSMSDCHGYKAPKTSTTSTAAATSTTPATSTTASTTSTSSKSSKKK
jgi:foldase protein PrsA